MSVPTSLGGYHRRHESIAGRLLSVSVMQLWWVAVWGIASLTIERLTRGSKRAEFALYGALLAAIVGAVVAHPPLLDNL